MIRNLPSSCSEQDIEAVIPTATAVRLIRERNSGESRGFGFAEFASVYDAQKFVESSGSIRVQGRVLHLDFSHGKYGESHVAKFDWVCNINGCDGYNFARRTSCFQCGLPKDPTLSAHVGSDDPRDPHRKDIYDSNIPSNVLVVRGVDSKTEEETIRYSFQPFLGLKEVRLVKDKVTNQSRGFAFVEFTSVEQATVALASSVGLRIDEAHVRVSFSADARGAPGIPGARKKGGPPPKRPANIAPTFVYDDPSGYWFDKDSRFYYNDTTQLYYHSDSGIYYRWDILKGSYVQTDERGVLMSIIQQEEAMKQKQKKPKERKKLDVSSISSISSSIPSNFNQSSSAASEESSKIIKSDTASTLDKQTLLGSIKFSLKSVNKDLEHWKKKSKMPKKLKRKSKMKYLQWLWQRRRLG